jgi:hypothetical protein
MTPEDVDRILSSDDTLEPASGFVVSVMQQVHCQAQEPPPRIFPWLRCTIGLVGCLTAAESATMIAPGLQSTFSRLCAPPASLTSIEPEVGYAIAALIVSFGLISYRRLKSNV